MKKYKSILFLLLLIGVVMYALMPLIVSPKKMLFITDEPVVENAPMQVEAVDENPDVVDVVIADDQVEEVSEISTNDGVEVIKKIDISNSEPPVKIQTSGNVQLTNEKSNITVGGTAKAEEPDESDELTEDDKARAWALATSKLSAGQIKKMITLAKGGFTQEEKAEAKEMFYANFTDEEQKVILDLYQRYSKQ